MISTPPSSLAASSAPLLAASKKPLPSDLTSSAIFMSAALAEDIMATSASAAPASSFVDSFIVFLPMLKPKSLLPAPFLGRRGGILLLRRSHRLHGDELYAGMGEHRGRLVRNPVVG